MIFLFVDKKVIIHSKLMKSSVQVDIVSMPQFTIKELKKLGEKTGSSKDIVSYIKTLSLREDRGTSTSKKRKKNFYKLQKLINEGNRLSEGRKDYGRDDDFQGSILEDYAQTVVDRVRHYWKLPHYLLEKNLQCRIRVFIGHTGKILQLNIFQSSGDEVYDQMALKAIGSAKPLNEPHNTLIKILEERGIILGFPL